MIELIKELGVILKDLPDLAIYIMIGVLTYKVFIIGSSFSLARFFIVKLHDFMSKPKKVVTEFEFDDVVYNHDGGIKELKSLLAYLKGINDNHNLSPEHIDFLREALNEKLERENIKTSTNLFTKCKKYNRHG